MAARVRPTAVVAGSAFPGRLGARLAHTLPVATLRGLCAAGRTHRPHGVRPRGDGPIEPASGYDEEVGGDYGSAVSRRR